jgi:hypothetical protein
MHSAGHRKTRPISLRASGELLAEGARFGEALHRLGPGSTFIPRGVYFFRSLADADRQRDRCLAEGMAMIRASQRHG